MAKLVRAISDMGGVVIAAIDSTDIVSEMEDAISLGVGEPDFQTPWHVREEGDGGHQCYRQRG